MVARAAASAELPDLSATCRLALLFTEGCGAPVHADAHLKKAAVSFRAAAAWACGEEAEDTAVRRGEAPQPD